jgi:hypothetical protein
MLIHRYFIPITGENEAILAEIPEKTILRFLVQEYNKDKRGYDIILEEIGKPVIEPSSIVYTFLDEGGYKVTYDTEKEKT